MDDLEKTLNELALAMQDHREALATKGVRKNPPGPRRKSQPDDARTALIARLLARIEAHAGLRVGEAIEARLGSVLASVELAELGRWVGGLERLDRTHPDWLTLIESLTINETFLFRDWPQLELLRTSGLAPLIAAAGRSAHPALRLWSAGCASGEEAYSLAVLAVSTAPDRCRRSVSLRSRCCGFFRPPRANRRGRTGWCGATSGGMCASTSPI